MATDYNIHKLFPKKYLEPADLGNKKYTLVMDEVRVERMGKEQELKPVLYFQNAQKGLVLNRTNGEMIGKLYGEQTGTWRGERITLYVTEVTAFGKRQDVIRVVDAVPATAPAKKQEEAPAPVQPQAAHDPILDTLTAAPDPADPDNDEDFFEYPDGEEDQDAEDLVSAMQASQYN